LKFEKMNGLLQNHIFLSNLRTPLSNVTQSREILFTNATRWKTYIPTISWYGGKNQYHLWLLGNGKDRNGLLRGDFGISYIDSQPIESKIWQKVGISFSLSIISIFLAYLISIPIGIYSAYKKDSAADKGMSLVLFVLYSMPSFFVATLLLLQFANPDNLSWFPVSGIQDPTIFDPNWSLWMKLKHRMPFLILPIITYTYGSFAFLSRIMRVGMIDVVSQDYIRTARAKGLGEGKVILKHALRNSLLPVITVFAAIFPMAIGGSIIIEVIFSIPGMGVEVLNSILNYDYPMIITVFTLSGFLTMIGYLVADLLYAVVDPRISYK
jgi:peptide/nickel transport system permease protein